MAKSAKSAKSSKSARGAGSARGGAKSAKSSRGAGAAKSTRGAKAAKSAKSTGRKTAGGGAKRAGGSAKRAGGSRKGGGGSANAAFMAPVTPSAELAEVVGDQPIPRTEVTKRLWAYIKKNDLQDPKNRRMIKADPTLKTVFGGKSAVNMFEMTKLVGKHLK